MFKHLPILLFFLFEIIPFFSNSQSIEMKKNYSYISKADAHSLIKEKEGVLNKASSILPAMAVYELNDSSAVIIKSYMKKAIVYFKKEDVLRTSEKQSMPKDIFEDFQDELRNFPYNKDSILDELSNALHIKIDLSDTSKSYSNKITKAVKSYQHNNASLNLLLGLTIFLGEQIIREKGGEWALKEIDYSGRKIINPYILSADGTKNNFFTKVLVDSLIGDAKFNWSQILELSLNV
jgi:hypothetical protein